MVVANGEEEKTCRIDGNGSRWSVSEVPEGALNYKKKLGIQHYAPLIAKITTRIRSWSARMLSYIGKLQLIKVVFSAVHLYWGQVVLILAAVMGELEALCRTYLWSGVVMN